MQYVCRYRVLWVERITSEVDNSNKWIGDGIGEIDPPMLRLEEDYITKWSMKWTHLCDSCEKIT